MEEENQTVSMYLYKQLYKQLREKDKEIKDLYEMIRKSEGVSEQINLDKIELLKKVRDFFCINDCNGNSVYTKDINQISDYIDSLIYIIKKEKK